MQSTKGEGSSGYDVSHIAGKLPASRLGRNLCGRVGLNLFALFKFFLLQLD